MGALRQVASVEYLEGYTLRVKFTNGKTKIIDFEEDLKNPRGMQEKLKDPAYFKKVKCDGYALCWPNGWDMCPDWLYMKGKFERKTVKPRKSSRIVRRKKRAKMTQSSRAT